MGAPTVFCMSYPGEVTRPSAVFTIVITNV
jgi:hypothetical protein